jgi:hypothetical protein
MAEFSGECFRLRCLDVEFSLSLNPKTKTAAGKTGKVAEAP